MTEKIPEFAEDKQRSLAERRPDSGSHNPSKEIERAWHDEVSRRIEEVRQGAVRPEPWSEVKKHIRDAREPYSRRR